MSGKEGSGAGGSNTTALLSHDTPALDEGAERLYVLVIAEHLITTVPLPTSGEVRIGRVSTCDIAIEDTSISRNHALLSIGPPLVLTDLGSANGTKVGDRTLAVNESATIAAGDVIQLGAATLIVQRRGPPIQAHRFLAHDYFEVRLEEECARWQRVDGAFAVARLHCEPPAGEQVVSAVLAAENRSRDVVGEYGPAELELLLLDIGPEPAAALVDQLVAGLGRHGVSARSGLACFPRDGLGAHELIHAASPFGHGKPEAEEAVSAAIAADRRMQDLYRLADRIAAGTITVLVLGETGVGKEVMAERVHRASPRAGGPYLRLSCAALSETLLESELFGHEKGAFTGANQPKQGLLETAHGGTVFLDEVGELPASIQVKLLRVLEERKVLRVGGLKPRELDVRFVAATNRDLETEVARGAFRQDLFFRLSGATLVIPPLRERASEIPGLARAFAEQAAQQMGMRRAPDFEPSALALLSSYGWPGNIRELRNTVERAVLLCEGGPISLAHLPVDKMRPGTRQRAASVRVAVPVIAAAPGGETDRERQKILHVLAACDGNQTEAAKMLGISRRTLINRLDHYGISGPRKKREG